MSYMQYDLEDNVEDQADEPARLQCRHIKTDGIRCGSPALRHEPFCYYHHNARRSGPRQPQVVTATDRKSTTFNLPTPADLNERSGVQLALALILHKIANNEIDPRRAGLLLYGLQIASGNLKGERPTKSYRQPDPVEELTEDPTHGPLAPEADLADADDGASPTLKRLIRRMKLIDDGPAIPTIQATATPTSHKPNRACRRQLLRATKKAAQSKRPGRSRAFHLNK